MPAQFQTKFIGDDWAFIRPIFAVGTSTPLILPAGSSLGGTFFVPKVSPADISADISFTDSTNASINILVPTDMNMLASNGAKTRIQIYSIDAYGHKETIDIFTVIAADPALTDEMPPTPGTVPNSFMNGWCA